MLESWREIIPDFDGLREVLAQPPATTLRANRLRIEGAALAAGLRRAGLKARALAWYPDAVEVEGLERPGATLEHFLGLYHVQGATSMIPPLALELAPGQRVLDLCAAPGSKTTQICELLQGRGWVLANDPAQQRLGILKAHLERLGHTAACLAARPGEAWPDGLLFDRVLVDAPCSGSGTWRLVGRQGNGPGEGQGEEAHEAEPARGWSREELAQLGARQRRLLRRAANLVVPGGVLVYSTCSYDPEENEVVLDELLRARPDLELEELPAAVALPGGGRAVLPPGEPGLTRWGNRRLLGVLERARRYYPHRGLNAAGFFVARLRRHEPPAGRRRRHRPGRPAAPAGEPAPARALRERALAYLRERFGLQLPAAWPGTRLQAAGRSVWLVAEAMPAWQALAPWRPQNPGLRLVRERGGRLKPTSYGLIALGAALVRGRVELQAEQLGALLRGERIARPGAELSALGPGYVAAAAGGRVLGCAWLGTAGLRGEIPRDAARRVQQALFVLGRPVALTPPPH
ncbi:MAG: hypothetical protein KatS3mg102_1631 [Planctomycetota bacterium]|nr:MAG: hypothetical protein KatS3mg102_1631 [Planctomycetota bacterium]